MITDLVDAAIVITAAYIGGIITEYCWQAVRHDHKKDNQ